MSALESAIRGGQPSTTTPIPPPCDSPKVVTRKSWPKVLPMWGSRINRHGAITTKEHAASLNVGTQACSLCVQRVSNPLIQDSGQHIRWAHRQECLCSESGTGILLMNSLNIG